MPDSERGEDDVQSLPDQRSPAELAPITNTTRRPRPNPPERPGTAAFVQAALVATAWSLAIGWWIAPAASRVGADWQWLAWIPDWSWLLGTAAPAAAAVVLAIWTPVHRMWRLGLPMLAIAGPAIGTCSRDLGWTSAIPQPGVRIIYLNAQSPSEADAMRDLEAIRRLDPDLVVVLNPGWLAPVWRSGRYEGLGSDEPNLWSVQWRSPVMTASTSGGCSIRTLLLDGEIRVLSVGLPSPLATRLGFGTLLVVDLPSDPRIDREAVANRLEAGMQKASLGRLDDACLVMGDFNMTPRTPALNRLRGRLRDLVSEGGSGWTATWPREQPILRIDQVLGSLEGDVRIETFDPGNGGHRGYVIDLPVKASDPGS